MPFVGFPLVDAAALRIMVGAVAFARGQEYARLGQVLDRSISYDPGDMRLYGKVRGKSQWPYECRVWLHSDRPEGSHVVAANTVCTCPVGYDCKHVVALILQANLMAVQGLARGQAELVPAWKRQLDRIITLAGIDSAQSNGGTSSGATSGTMPLALQFRTVGFGHDTRQSWARVPGLEMRAATRGKRGAWVAVPGMAWNAIRPTSRIDGATAAQVRWFATLAMISDAATVFGPWLPVATLEADLLWRHLAGAADLGIQLVGDSPFDTVSLVGGIDHVIDISRSPDGLTLTQSVLVDGEPAPGATLLQVGHVGLAAITTDQVATHIALGPGRGSPAVGEITKRLPLTVPPDGETDFWDTVYPGLTRAIRLTSANGSVEFPTPPRALLEGTMVASGPTELRLTWRWAYQVGKEQRTFGIAGLGTEAERIRDFTAEAAILNQVEAVRQAHRCFAPPGLLPPGQPNVIDGLHLATFVFEALPALEALDGVTMVGTPPAVTLREESPEFSVEAVSDVAGDWFDLHVTVSFGPLRFDFRDLFEALARGDKHLLAPDGSVVALDHPALDRLRELIGEATRLSDKPGRPRLGRYQAGLWGEIADVTGGPFEGAAAWQESVAQLRHLAQTDTAPVEVPPPAGLTATLRPYQQRGFEWLVFLWEHHLGGILADDMGLGKTVQALALMLHARTQAPGEPPFLVVAPSSVVANWLLEAARFTPGLDVRPATETRRTAGVSMAELCAGADVVVTSYAVFRLDNEAFRAQTWAGLILDEAQFAKNPATKANQQARALQAPFKVAVTGTPMENSLDELWAVFTIVAPGMLGSHKQFREVYAAPIAAGGEAGNEALARLRRRARPLLMRRTKDMVAPELPERLEQVVEIELAPRHRKVYDTYLQRERKRMLGLLEDYEANRFAIFRSLTTLRRLALDASLVDPDLAGVPSSKLDQLMELLAEVVAGGHRALVFSQFTTYLAKAAERLKAAGLQYAYLDGSTPAKDRAGVIAGFKDGTAPVFLISLKAGGFGLNLTEADYVFLLDPWWNPATENQAIDRTHRIGQTRNVMVFRLVAQQTIEDKVMALKAKKAALFDAVLDAEGAFSGALTAEDVRALLA